MTDTRSQGAFELPLFPLRSVLFPGGLLGLKVFEARYLDLVGTCLRSQKPFGVVALRQGDEVRRPMPAGMSDDTQFEEMGVLAELLDVDSAQSGILQVRCRGTSRFKLLSTTQRADGLWMAEALLEPDDSEAAVPDALKASAAGLEAAIITLKAQGTEPFLQPYLFDDAGWVANRWCEILPIPMAAKQRLMSLTDAITRLELVHDFLRSKGVVD